MLMSLSYNMLNSLEFKLVFDDDTVKQHEVSLNDTIKVTFNKNGQRKTVEGIVKRIFLDTPGGQGPNHHHSCVCKPAHVMLIDGSQFGCSACEHVDASKVLDLDIIRKDKLNSSITTPVGEDAVTQFRLVGNILQLSKDFGVTWMKVLTLPDKEIEISEEDKELAEKVGSIIPSSLRPDMKSDLILDIVNLVKEELSENTNTSESNPSTAPTETPEESTSTTTI